MSYESDEKKLKAKFRDQKYEIKSLIKHLSKADIFIDVGANCWHSDLLFSPSHPGDIQTGS